MKREFKLVAADDGEVLIHRPTVLTRIFDTVKSEHAQSDMMKAVMQYRPRDPDDYNLPDILKAKVILRISAGRRHEGLILEVLRSVDTASKNRKSVYLHHYRGFRLFIDFLRRNGIMVRNARDGNSPLMEELQKKYDLEIESVYNPPKAKRKAR